MPILPRVFRGNPENPAGNSRDSPENRVGKWPLFSPNNVFYPTTPPMQNIGNPLLTIYHSELGKYIIFIEQETSKISLVKPAYRSVYHWGKYTN